MNRRPPALELPDHRLLLVDGSGAVWASPLSIRTLREFPGRNELSVHFRPVRSDALFESAKAGGQLAFRILAGEGRVRAQLWVEFEVAEPVRNVIGRSSDLSFALALLTAQWPPPNAVGCIAATGVLDADGRVHGVDGVPEKLAAAVESLGAGPGVIFYAAVDAAAAAAAIEAVRRGLEPGSHLRLKPVAHLDEALGFLGYALEKVYLRNPFRGLKPYGFRHRAVYFGRDREIRDVVKLLRRRERAGCPGILIEGASGSGKSSFLQAGVLPALSAGRSLPARDAEFPVWRPGLLARGLLAAGSGEAALAEAVLGCWRAHPELAAALGDRRADSLAALAALRRESWPTLRNFVWVIDPFEELFHLGLPDALLEAFGRFLATLQADGVWTLASIRADAVPRFKEVGTLRQVFGANEAQYYLAPMEGTALDDVIERPAAAAGLTFGAAPDGRSLDDILREDAYRESGSLPALQFTLERLYAERVGCELSHAAYRRLGGIRGSIASTAAAVAADCSAEERDALPRLFRHLVAVDGQARVTRRYAALADIAPDGPAQRLLQRWVGARLCVTDQRDGQGVAAFAHDTLLETLPALAAWLREESGLLQLRELAQREAELWAQHGKTDAWLAGADKLAGFKAVEAAAISLPALTREFILRSGGRVRRMRRIERAAVALITLLAGAASLAGWIASRKQHEAEVQTTRTLAAQSRLLTETAATRLGEGALAYARGILLEVSSRAKSPQDVDAAAINLLQEIRGYDTQVAVLSGHGDSVRRGAFAPDGRRVVTTSLDHTARLWDARTGTELAVLAGHARAVMCADYSPDGTRIVTASDAVRIWDARSGALLSTFGGEEELFSTAYYSPDGRTLLTTSRQVTLRDAASGAPLRRLYRARERLAGATFSRDGRFVVVAADDHVARVFDLRTGAEVARLIGHTDALHSAHFSPDGRTIVTAADDATARIWDARSGAPLRVLSGNAGQVWDAEFSPDGARVVTVSTDKNARIFDAASGALLRLLSGHPHIVTSARFSPDGRHILTTGYDGTSRLWEAQVGSDARVLAHRQPVNQAAYSPDGTRLLTASEDEAAGLWDPRSGQPVGSLPGHPKGVLNADYSPDGRFVVTAAGDAARIWDVATASVVGLLPNRDQFGSVAYSPDGMRIVTAGEDSTVRTWDARTLTPLAEFKGHTNSAGTAEFSPDGTRVLTASVDKTARVWDARSGAQLLLLPHPDMLNSAAFSSDGGRIVTASEDKLARIWDARSGALLRVLAGHHARIFAAAFSPDGRRVVTGARDGTVRIWDADSGAELAVLAGHEARVVSVAYAPDGRHIASASLDKTVRIWDAALPADLRSQMIWERAVESDPMSVVERAQLGIAVAEPVVPGGALATDCDRQAGAFYDPDRRAPGVRLRDITADIAAPACNQTGGVAPHGRQLYEAGRVQLAKGDLRGARSALEAARAEGQRAAGIDLGDALDAPGETRDSRAAAAAYERAWQDGVPVGAFKLGALYESGAAGPAGVARDLERAWAWYRQGAKAGEPHALGRLARDCEERALEAAAGPAADALWLQAFRLHARAAEQASRAQWPDAAWRHWRYRRASLARFLAREGMMPAVARAFDEVEPQR